MTHTYLYPQASPCGAVLMFSREKGKNPRLTQKLNLLTTFRSESVGTGRSLAAGGFYEVKDMFDKKPDEFQDGDLELYRECVEELGDNFSDIIPFEDFRKRVRYLWHGLNKTGRINEDGTPEVHSIMQKTLELTPEEMQKVLELGETSEQKGMLLETFNMNAKSQDEADELDVRTRLVDFKYQVEIEAAVKWYRQEKQALVDLAMR